MNALIVMQPGKRYLIVYRIQPHTLPRAAVLDFIEYDERREVFIMSGRPAVATQQLPYSWITFIEEVPKRVDCFFNERPAARKVQLVREQMERLAERHYDIENGGL